MTINPDRKVNNTTNAGSLLAYSDVKRAIIAVGPTVISLQLPKIMYMKHPINAEYKPY